MKTIPAMKIAAIGAFPPFQPGRGSYEDREREKQMTRQSHVRYLGSGVKSECDRVKDEP